MCIYSVFRCKDNKKNGRLQEKRIKTHENVESFTKVSYLCSVNDETKFAVWAGNKNFPARGQLFPGQGQKRSPIGDKRNYLTLILKF